RKEPGTAGESPRSGSGGPPRPMAGSLRKSSCRSLVAGGAPPDHGAHDAPSRYRPMAGGRRAGTAGRAGPAAPTPTRRRPAPPRPQRRRVPGGLNGVRRQLPPAPPARPPRRLGHPGHRARSRRRPGGPLPLRLRARGLVARGPGRGAHGRMSPMAARSLPSPPRRRRPTVATVICHGVAPFEMAVPCEVFGIDRSELGVPWYRHRVCAAEPPPIRSSQGFTIDTPYGLDDVVRAGTVVVPAWGADPGGSGRRGRGDTPQPPGQLDAD